MRLLTGFVLILLCFGSCQQRYGHVKKIKADKINSVATEQVLPREESETLTAIPEDTLKEEGLIALEKSIEYPKAKTEVPEKKAQSSLDKPEDVDGSREFMPFKQLLPILKDKAPKEQPLNSSEKLLILCVFYFWFSIFSFIAFIPAAIVLVLWFLYLVGGLPLVATSTIILLLTLSGILLILSFIFSFRVGKKQIQKLLNREFFWHELLGYFLFSILILILSSALFVVFIDFVMVAAVVQFLPYILFIFAAIYIKMW